MNTDRILDKVKKLLALAQDPSAAPQEAETAARQAASLLAKYNLDLGDLTDRELEAEWDITEAVMPGCRPGKKNPKVVPSWIGILAFGVKLYTRTRVISRGGMVVFRGARQDVELGHWMLKALIELAYRQSQSSDDPGGFRNGFAQVVQRRLRALADDRDKLDAESPTSLVVVDKLQSKLDELYGQDRSKRSRTRASEDGRLAGQSVALPTSRPIPQGGTAKALPLH